MVSHYANTLRFCDVVSKMYILNEFIIFFVQKYVNKTLTKELTKIRVHVTIATIACH